MLLPGGSDPAGRIVGAIPYLPTVPWALATGGAARIWQRLWLRESSGFESPDDQNCFPRQLPPWISGKDLILYTIGQLGVDGARYAALEFCGPVIEKLEMDARFTIANMAIEAGAKAGLIAPDEITFEYLAGRAQRPYTALHGDVGAPVSQEFNWDVSTLEPQVSLPSSPANARPVTAAAGTAIDQVVIGSCTNGRMDDLRQAATLLEGRQVHPRVRLIVIPATQAIYLQALQEGLLETFIRAQAVVSTPTCGPCLGGHMGILAAGEVAVATTNRNFTGRMGHREPSLPGGAGCGRCFRRCREITHPAALQEVN